MPQTTALWQQIRQRPGLYLGSSSISALHHFLGGWNMALARHGIEDDALRLPMDFHEWVAYREHFSESTSGWCRMLLEHFGSEEAALQQFFALHDEYLVRVPREFAHVDNHKRSTKHEIDGEWKCLEHSGSLTLLTYTDDPGFFTHYSAPNWSLRDDFHSDPQGWLEASGSDFKGLTIVDQQEYERVMSSGATKMQQNMAPSPGQAGLDSA